MGCGARVSRTGYTSDYTATLLPHGAPLITERNEVNIDMTRSVILPLVRERLSIVGLIIVPPHQRYSVYHMCIRMIGND